MQFSLFFFIQPKKKFDTRKGFFILFFSKVRREGSSNCWWFAWNAEGWRRRRKKEVFFSRINSLLQCVHFFIPSFFLIRLFPLTHIFPPLLITQTREKKVTKSVCVYASQCSNVFLFFFLPGDSKKNKNSFMSTPQQHEIGIFVQTFEVGNNNQRGRTCKKSIRIYGYAVLWIYNFFLYIVYAFPSFFKLLHCYYYYYILLLTEWSSYIHILCNKG